LRDFLRIEAPAVYGDRLRNRRIGVFLRKQIRGFQDFWFFTTGEIGLSTEATRAGTRATAQNNITRPEAHVENYLLSVRFEFSFSQSCSRTRSSSTATRATRIPEFQRSLQHVHHPFSHLFLVYNEHRDSVSGNLIDRPVIAKFTYIDLEVTGRTAIRQ